MRVIALSAPVLPLGFIAQNDFLREGCSVQKLRALTETRDVERSQPPPFLGCDADAWKEVEKVIPDQQQDAKDACDGRPPGALFLIPVRPLATALDSLLMRVLWEAQPLQCGPCDTLFADIAVGQVDHRHTSLRRVARESHGARQRRCGYGLACR
jgi:hypothetical protein